VRESWLQVAPAGQPEAFLMKLLKALQATGPVGPTQSVEPVGLERKVKPPLILGRKWLGEL